MSFIACEDKSTCVIDNHRETDSDELVITTLVQDNTPCVYQGEDLDILVQGGHGVPVEVVDEGLACLVVRGVGRAEAICNAFHYYLKV